MTSRTESRTRSTPSPARNASSNSDTADWGRAIGGLLFDVCLAVHTEDLADGPSTSGAPPSYPKPHHVPGLLRQHDLGHDPPHTRDARSAGLRHRAVGLSPVWVVATSAGKRLSSRKSRDVPSGGYCVS